MLAFSQKRSDLDNWKVENSNNINLSECTPDDVYNTTKGKGLVATGSPFEPIEGEYGKMLCAQSNNMYIFPGVGLGALVAKSPIITYKMFLVASKKLASLLTEDELKVGKLLPDLENIREISSQIATTVAIEARNSGLGKIGSD